MSEKMSSFPESREKMRNSNAKVVLGRLKKAKQEDLLSYERWMRVLHYRSIGVDTTLTSQSPLFPTIRAEDAGYIIQEVEPNYPQRLERILDQEAADDEAKKQAREEAEQERKARIYQDKIRKDREYISNMVDLRHGSKRKSYRSRRAEKGLYKRTAR